MSKIITRIAAVGAAVSIGAGGLALTAPTADAATYKKVGTATVKEGSKVVREADQQRCLTVKETRKIVKGNGEYLGIKGAGIRQLLLEGHREGGVPPRAVPRRLRQRGGAGLRQRERLLVP